MDTVLENEARIKEIFKTAIVEILEERKDLFSDMFREVTEDIALAQAIEEGEKSPEVSRSAVFDVLGERQPFGNAVARCEKSDAFGF